MKEKNNLKAVDEFLEGLIEIQSKYGENVEICTNFAAVLPEDKLSLMRDNDKVLTIESNEPALILTANFTPKKNNKNE